MTARSAASSSGARRSAARLAVVQALYQIELSGDSVGRVVDEFLQLRLNSGDHGGERPAADPEWFADVVRGYHARAAEIDALVGGCLDKERSLGRLEAIQRALLRAGAYELLARPDVPARVVISEYVDVAHAFFGGAEPGFANGVLDQLARRIRGDEIGGAGGARARSPR